MKNIVRAFNSLAVSFLLVGPVATAQADMLESVAASPFTGPTQVKSGYGSPQGDYRPYDTGLNLAFQGNGFARAAVAKDEIFYSNIHQEEFANDGFYGNGASWIGSSNETWLKIDLGRVARIESISFGRDRLGAYDDRDPGQFRLAVALDDDVYASGNNQNDTTEYSQIFDSSLFGYSGSVNGAETLQVTFSSPMSARFVKLTLASGNAAIDEVEVRGVVVPEPGSLVLTGIGCACGLGGALRRRVAVRSEGRSRS